MANKGFANWISSLLTGSAASGGNVPVVQGGVTKRLPVGQADGLATVDAAGKLAQPRRVLGIYKPAPWANIDTTADYTSAPVVGIVDVPAEPYTRYALLLSNLGLYAVDTANTYVRGVFVYSTDGGVTWNQLGHNPVENRLDAGRYISYPLAPTLLVLAATTTYKIGIRAGNGAAGGPTVRVYGYPYSSHLALVVDY